MPRPIPENIKHCPNCKTTKPVKEFYSSTNYSGGYSPYCKVCHAQKNKENRNIDRDRKYKREAYSKNPDKFRELSRKNQNKLKRERPAFFRAKKFFDTKRIGVAEDVTKEWLEYLFENTKQCQCCGKELELDYKDRATRRYRSNPNSPSIDRVNNNRGYSRDNMAIICWECNYRKTDLTEADLVKLLAYIRKF